MKIGAIRNIQSAYINKNNGNKTSTRPIVNFKGNDYGDYLARGLEDQSAIERIAKSFNVPENKAARFYAYYIAGYIRSLEGLDDVQGFKKEKFELATKVVKPIAKYQKKQERSCMQFVPSGTLLYGPPRTGKTYLADKLCENLASIDANIFEAKFSGNQTEDAVVIRNIFSQAAEQFQKTRKYSIINIKPDINIINKDNITKEFLKYAYNCSKNGISWISTSDDPLKIRHEIFSDRIATLAIPIGFNEDFDYASAIKHLAENYAKEGKDSNFDYDKIASVIAQSGYTITLKEIFLLTRATMRQGKEEARIPNTDMFIDNLNKFGKEGRFCLNSSVLDELQKNKLYIEDYKNNVD